MRFVSALLLSLAIFLPVPVLSKSGRGGSSQASHAHVTHGSTSVSVPRDAHGRIQRTSAARSSFQHANLCPSTGKTSGACPGHVVDHVRPLKRGGADSPSNMQWQTTQAAKQKDRTE